MMARTTSITMQNLMEIERRTSVWADEMWCFSLFLFVNNAREINGHKWRSCVIQEEIALAFVGRFRCCLQLFFAEENAFPADWSVFKILARWRYDWSANALENFQNLRKWVQSLCTLLRPSRSDFKENFYHSLIPHVLQMCTHIKIFR